MGSNKQILIAGPCAVESHNQVVTCARKLGREVCGFRSCLWKPRTAPGFEGVGEVGIPWLAEVAQMGLTIALEALLPEHITSVIRGLAGLGVEVQLLFWLGSRNQNHMVQKMIAERLLAEGPSNALLMIKNQPWKSMDHWLGIFEHVLQTGFPEDRILFCHRGFVSDKGDNPYGFRNPPDFEMAMRVQAQTGRPMILDPSHIAGLAENVVKVMQNSLSFPFDGFMIEVHPDPATALTDAPQQLSLDQLQNIFETGLMGGY